MPAELAYVSVHGMFPTDRDVVKYGLEYALNRLVRGESSEQDLMRQNVIMLQFNYARKSMHKFYQHFLEVWGFKITISQHYTIISHIFFGNNTQCFQPYTKGETMHNIK